MNQGFLLPVVAAAVLCAACASPMKSTVGMGQPGQLGEPAPVAAATRQVRIAPETNRVDVANGETVKFVVGSKSFAWTFDGSPDGYAFDLQRVAPSVSLGHSVEANVAANPMYVGSPGE